jgi:hypothetical protein
MTTGNDHEPGGSSPYRERATAGVMDEQLSEPEMPFHLRSEETVYKGRVIHVAIAQVEGPDGERHVRDVMRHPGAVAVVLLFSFGMPLMPVDRHVERVAKRIGLIPPKATALQAHDLFLALLAPEQVHEGHVNLITHGRQTCFALRPACGRCAINTRCRYFDRRAP